MKIKFISRCGPCSSFNQSVFINCSEENKCCVNIEHDNKKIYCKDKSLKECLENPTIKWNGNITSDEIFNFSKNIISNCGKESNTSCLSNNDVFITNKEEDIENSKCLNGKYTNFLLYEFQNDKCENLIDNTNCKILPKFNNCENGYATIPSCVNDTSKVCCKYEKIKEMSETCDYFELLGCVKGRRNLQGKCDTRVHHENPPSKCPEVCCPLSVEVDSLQNYGQGVCNTEKRQYIPDSLFKNIKVPLVDKILAKFDSQSTKPKEKCNYCDKLAKNGCFWSQYTVDCDQLSPNQFEIKDCRYRYSNDISVNKSSDFKLCCTKNTDILPVNNVTVYNQTHEIINSCSIYVKNNSETQNNTNDKQICDLFCPSNSTDCSPEYFKLCKTFNCSPNPNCDVKGEYPTVEISRNNTVLPSIKYTQKTCKVFDDISERRIGIPDYNPNYVRYTRGCDNARIDRIIPQEIQFDENYNGRVMSTFEQEEWCNKCASISSDSNCRWTSGTCNAEETNFIYNNQTYDCNYNNITLCCNTDAKCGGTGCDSNCNCQTYKI